MYTDNELLFPNYVIPSLRDLRGPKWRDLVDHIAPLEETHVETLAFMLMMIRLNGCMSCETDSYRAMRGCTACAHQTLRRFKGSDEDLLDLYETALDNVHLFAGEHPQINILCSA